MHECQRVESSQSMISTQPLSTLILFTAHNPFTLAWFLDSVLPAQAGYSWSIFPGGSCILIQYGASNALNSFRALTAVICLWLPIFLKVRATTAECLLFPQCELFVDTVE